MSLSNPKVSSPCKKFIEFKGNTGVFQYWNKEKKENVQLEYPIKFIVLDELNTITGYSDSTQSGIYSNEVHNLKETQLNVRSFKGGLKLIGMYADIKPRITEIGGKFCKSVYAALLVGDGLELVNFKLKGIGFSAWMERDASESGVIIKGCTDGKKGSIKYKIPIFQPEKFSQDLMGEALDKDKVLQMYLSSYKENKVDEAIQPDAKEANEDQEF